MHVSPERMRALVRDGQLQELCISRNRCQVLWLNRDSVNQWVARRDAQLACYMPRREAHRALGLGPMTILNVARSGLIRHVKGTARAICFHREDIAKIKNAFAKYAIPLRECSKAGDLITLRDAIRNYLGNDSGLAAVIGAVAKGSLVPIRSTDRFARITSYLFPLQDLRKYLPISRSKVPPEELFCHSEVASVLDTPRGVVTALVAHGVFTRSRQFGFRASKLIPSSEVQKFCETYVKASVLARSFQVTRERLASYLKQLGSRILTIPVPASRHWTARFVPRELASRIRILRNCATGEPTFYIQGNDPPQLSSIDCESLDLAENVSLQGPKPRVR